MTALRILCVEDDAHFREFLVSLLQPVMGAGTVIHEAADGATALSLARSHQPDLVLLDVGLPDISGLQVAGALSLLSRQPRVLILTSYAPEQVLKRIHPSQVSGLLLKSDVVGSELIEGLQAVLHDRPYYSRHVREVMAATRDHLRRYAEFLSPLELELLPLFGTGWTNEQIASRIHLSGASIQNLRQSILHKLDLPHTKQLIEWAVIHGIGEWKLDFLTEQRIAQGLS